MNIPEFHIGDCVTYWPGDHGMNMVVIDLRGQVYRLIEAPEAKPLSEHLRVTCTGADILQSELFKNKREPTIWNIEKPL